MVLRDFGFEVFEADLSTKPDKYVGRDDLWQRATDALTAALETAGLSYEVAEGRGRFLWAQDRPACAGCDRSKVAAEHHSGRLRAARRTSSWSMRPPRTLESAR